MKKIPLDNSKHTVYDLNVGLVPTCYKAKDTIKKDKMLLSNNSRKMAGLPLLRKKNSKKRFFTRCEVFETVGLFLDYCRN